MAILHGSVETLSHYRCGTCGSWFSVGDNGGEPPRFCCFCGAEFTELGSTLDELVTAFGDVKQFMTYEEREKVKQVADEAISEGWTEKAGIMLIIIAHWMRQSYPIRFNEYASQWLTAHRYDPTYPRPLIEELKREYPLAGGRKIGDNRSDWFSYEGAYNGD